MTCNRIQKPLVFVLGAGAHFPFGFPTGAGLREHMLLNFSGNMYGMHIGDSKAVSGMFAQDRAKKLGDKLREVENRHDAFRKAFLWSLLPSIDDFLRHRDRDFGVWGKKLLTALMLHYEGSARDNLGKTGFDWFGTVWNHINCSATELPSQRISFITFNYDRTIEHFLCNAAANAAGISLTDAWKYASQVEVIHLHGSIGQYVPDDAAQIKAGTYMYGDQFDLASFAEPDNSTNGKTDHQTWYWNANQESPEWDKARKLVRDARMVYVLGLGSAAGPLNALIQGPIVNAHRKIHLTATGLRPAEQRRLMSAAGFEAHVDLNNVDTSFTANDLVRSTFSVANFVERDPSS